MLGVFDLWFPVVDVRDVAAGHADALEVPEAAGQRFIVGSGEGLTMGEIAQALRAELGEDARKVPTRPIPSWVVRAAARFVPAMKDVATELGSSKRIDIAQAESVLGLRPCPAREAVVDSARSMIAQGVLSRG